MAIQGKDHYSFDSPETYRIRVQGRVKQNWSDRLDGMMVSISTADDGISVSVLTGELADQAALTGVINTLYELHLPILLVECLTCHCEKERQNDR